MMPDSQFNENWGAQLSAEVWDPVIPNQHDSERDRRENWDSSHPIIENRRLPVIMPCDFQESQ